MSAQIVPATMDRLSLLASVLGRAFAADPILRWTLGTAEDDAATVGHYFHILDEGFVELGMLWETSGGAGVALWVPSGQTARFAEVDAACRARVHELTDDGGDRHDSFWDWTESKIPDGPLWFLDHIGVDPPRQGGGIGSALLAFGIDRARAQGASAFLETAVATNVALYERFGFRVVEDLDAPQGGPHIWFMRWDP
jgi:GNAT superfamily N-acetyltransferase